MTDALFAPERVVAYLVVRAHARALVIFRTARRPAAISSIVGVSRPVDVLFVASTVRTVRKVISVLRFLARHCAPDVDALPDRFWLRLADAVSSRRDWRVAPHVTELLRAATTPR